MKKYNEKVRNETVSIEEKGQQWEYNKPYDPLFL
jgi:hypothetical protein